MIVFVDICWLWKRGTGSSKLSTVNVSAAGVTPSPTDNDVAPTSGDHGTVATGK